MTRSGWLAVVGIGVALVAAGCGDTIPAAPTLPAGSTSSGTTTTSPPTVTAISPANGGDVGGTIVTISGTNFTAGATVLIGGISASGVIVLSDTAIQCTTAANNPGTYDVQVTIGSNSAKLANAFTFLPAVDTTLVFTVYNHTRGVLGRWTATRSSGTSVTLDITALGEVDDENGNVVVPPIPLDTVDSKRMVVRTAASGGLTGAWVASTIVGTLNFTVPYVDRQAYDIFLMNAVNGADYTAVDSGFLSFPRSALVSRGADAGTTGPDALVTQLAQELDRTVALPWMRYGRVARTAATGDVVVSYLAPNAGACVTFTRTKGAIYANPDACTTSAQNLTSMMLLGGYEMFSGLHAIGGDSSSLLDTGTMRFTPIGFDLLAYIYLKDPKAW
jgi:hypothetical protein